MSLTYDQKSELTLAFQEAHVPADRRRTHRIKQKIAAEITEWEHEKPGRTFGVMIEDFSTHGVAMTHSGRLRVGKRYTLEVPRPGLAPIKVVLTVVRCDEMDAGQFATQMEASHILAGRSTGKRGRRMVGPMVALAGVLAFAGALAFYLGMFN